MRRSPGLHGFDSCHVPARASALHRQIGCWFNPSVVKLFGIEFRAIIISISPPAFLADREDNSVEKPIGDSPLANLAQGRHHHRGGGPRASRLQQRQ